MREFELLDLLTLISLLYQADSNELLRNQASNDDILKAISEDIKILSNQNNRIIELLERLCKKQEN